MNNHRRVYLDGWCVLTSSCCRKKHILSFCFSHSLPPRIFLVLSISHPLTWRRRGIRPILQPATRGAIKTIWVHFSWVAMSSIVIYSPWIGLTEMADVMSWFCIPLLILWLESTAQMGSLSSSLSMVSVMVWEAVHWKQTDVDWRVAGRILGSIGISTVVNPGWNRFNPMLIKLSTSFSHSARQERVESWQ